MFVGTYTQRELTVMRENENVMKQGCDWGSPWKRRAYFMMTGGQPNLGHDDGESIVVICVGLTKSPV